METTKLMVGIVILSLLGVLSHWGLTRARARRHSRGATRERRAIDPRHDLEGGPLMRRIASLSRPARRARRSRRPPRPRRPAKVKVGVLKLTSSAPVFVGVEKGFFKEFGIEPELVFFQAAAPIATALAAGQLDVGATGLTAALYNIVLGGEQLWIVADKGREWPGYPLVGHRRAEGALGRRRPVDRGSQGQAHRRDPARLDVPLPHRQHPREGRAQARRRQARAAPGDARHRRGAEGQAGRRHPRAAAVSRRRRRRRASARSSRGRAISTRGRSRRSSTRRRFAADRRARPSPS